MADNTENTNKSTESAETKPVTASLKIETDNKYEPSFPDVQNAAEYFQRGVDRGVVNTDKGSSMLVRNSGDISLSAGLYSTMKVGADGKHKTVSMQNETITNRFHVKTDDFVVNNHKMNPDLWELAEMKDVLSDDNKYIAGNLTMCGSVLVKAWDAQLKRYVLIRRPIRTPLFFPMMNTEKIPSSLHINDSTNNSGQSNLNSYSSTDSAYSSSTNNAGTTAGASAGKAAGATKTPDKTDSKTATDKTGSNETKTEDVTNGEEAAKTTNTDSAKSTDTAVAEASDKKNDKKKRSETDKLLDEATTAAKKAAKKAGTDLLKKVISTAVPDPSILEAAKKTAEDKKDLKTKATNNMTEGETAVNTILDNMVQNKVEEVIKTNGNRNPAEIRVIAEATARAMQKSFKDNEDTINDTAKEVQKAVDKIVDDTVKEQTKNIVAKELKKHGVDTDLANPVVLKAMEKSIIKKYEQEVRTKFKVDLADKNLVAQLLLTRSGLDNKVKNTTGSMIDKITDSSLGRLLPAKDREKLNSKMKIIVNKATTKIENNMVESVKDSVAMAESQKRIKAGVDRYSEIEKDVMIKAAEAQELLQRWENTARDMIKKAEDWAKDELHKIITSIKW